MLQPLRPLLTCLLCLSLLSANGEGAPGGSQGGALESIGIYNCYTGMPVEAIPFFKACGYNTYQRWDLGWTRWPAKHEQYYADVARDVQRMQEAGLKAYVILTINMRQRRAGEPEGYRGSLLFEPGDQALMQERLEYITATVRKLRMADGFTIFAGDPGGHGAAKPAQVVEATKKIIAIITQEAPKAEINVNTWGIAAWEGNPSPYRVAFWEKEVQLTRDLTGRPDIVGPQVGIEFPLHNYYRSLALKCYADAGKPRELFPTGAEVAVLKQRGAKRLWGWPYFLTDECDDGYSPGTAGMAQSETRYLKQIVDAGRRLGLNGMIANAFESNVLAESLNLYAFARFCKDPEATPEQVIRQFAGLISEPETAAELAQVLKFIENHSTWQAGLPQQHRLPNFDVAAMTSAGNALDTLGKVAISQRCPLPMAGPPAAYVEKLKKRLRIILAKEKQGEQ